MIFRFSLLIPLLGSLLLVLVSCRQKATQTSTSASTDSDTIIFDLENIEAAGELIAVTLSGPENHFQYHGVDLGLQYLLAEQFAGNIGVRIRMEQVQDTAALLDMLRQCKADLIACQLPDSLLEANGLTAAGAFVDSLHTSWSVRKSSPQLSENLKAWFRPHLTDSLRQVMNRLMTMPRIQHSNVPVMSVRKGAISAYDGLFIKYARTIQWDWRLLAAQCSQESAFDCKAVSWAGARGLMQIMPQTANLLGVQSSELFHPETNIMTAVKYISQLEKKFSDVRHPVERRKFVLAAYNGGYNHIRDAMNLARHDKRNPYSWNVVSYYVLHLSEPRFYRHPVVKNGYMIGQETFNYVNRILQKWNAYVTGRHTPSPLPQADDLINVIPHKAHKKNRFSGEGNAILSRSDSIFN